MEAFSLMTKSTGALVKEIAKGKLGRLLEGKQKKDERGPFCFGSCKRRVSEWKAQA